MTGEVPTSEREAGPPAVRVVDRRLLEMLVCPVTRAPLTYDPERSELVSRGANLAFPVQDGVPIMLVDEARALEE